MLLFYKAKGTIHRELIPTMTQTRLYRTLDLKIWALILQLAMYL